MSPRLNASTETAPGSPLREASGQRIRVGEARVSPECSPDPRVCRQVRVAQQEPEATSTRRAFLPTERGAAARSGVCSGCREGVQSCLPCPQCEGRRAHLPRAPAPTRSLPVTTGTPCCFPCRWPAGAAVGPTGRRARGTAARAPRTVSASERPRSRRRSGRCLRRGADRPTASPPPPALALAPPPRTRRTKPGPGHAGTHWPRRPCVCTGATVPLGLFVTTLQKRKSRLCRGHSCSGAWVPGLRHQEEVSAERVPGGAAGSGTSGLGRRAPPSPQCAWHQRTARGRRTAWPEWH